MEKVISEFKIIETEDGFRIEPCVMLKGVAFWSTIWEAW